MRCPCSALCARTLACRSSNWPIRRKLRSRAPSRRSATRIWPARASFGTAPALATVPPVPIDWRGSSSDCRDGFMSSDEWHARTLRAWQLAILRFAVTLDNADRLAVLAIAAEMDGLDPLQDRRSAFGFFRRTSAELCAAILQPNERSSTLLRQHLARIEDEGLKRI